MLLFLFAWGFRLIYLVESTVNPLFGFPVVDAHAYAQWAAQMAKGEWLWHQVGNYLPIYPAFLAVQELIFGASVYAPKIIQTLMGALAAVVMAQTAARIWNRNVGLIGGYLIATNWMLVVFEAEKYAESFSIFFQSLTLWLLIQFPRRLWAAAAAGFAFALSAGARANLFLIFPVVLGWVFCQQKTPRLAAITAAAVFGAGTVFLIGPILVRNYQITGAPLLRAQASWSLYAGLEPQFKGLHPPPGILFQKHMRRPSQEGMRSVAESERFWAAKIWQLMRTNPWGVAANFLRRLVIFFNAREWSQEFDVYAYRGYSGFLSLPWTSFGLIGPLGMLGLVLARPATRTQRLVWLYTLVGMLSIIPFKVSDRYRLPTVVLLSLFAAVALWQLFGWLRAKNGRALLTVLPVLGLLCVFSWPDWQHLTVRKTARHHFFLGLCYESQGRREAAIEAYATSLQTFAWDADSPYRIGHLLLQRGDVPRASIYLEEALRREPQFAEARNDLARIHLRAGNLAAAELQVQASLQFFPHHPQTLLLMAQIQRRQGKIDAEIASLQQAVAESQDPQIAILLAGRLAELGKYAEAVHWYETVIASRPVDSNVRTQAAMLAGITVARFLKDNIRAQGYWQIILKESDARNSIVLQAKFLVAEVDEATFREQMQDSAESAVSAEYLIGLRHWLNRDRAAARKAFERCLALAFVRESETAANAVRWAQEDLRRIRAEESQLRRRPSAPEGTS
ncbi:MAG: tetratricopeptide repeat protein [Desulfobacterales bacterium]|nr:MAG: tetratricopeptide repeat protein [Desulfobacterales bacterium]